MFNIVVKIVFCFQCVVCGKGLTLFYMDLQYSDKIISPFVTMFSTIKQLYLKVSHIFANMFSDLSTSDLLNLEKGKGYCKKTTT